MHSVGFDQPAWGVWYAVELLVDLYFYVDLVLNFFTAYYEDNRVGALRL